MALEVLQRPLVSIAPMTTVEGARREWAEGHRRFVQEASDPARADAAAPAARRRHRRAPPARGRDVHPRRARGRVRRRGGLAAGRRRRARAVQGVGAHGEPCVRCGIPRVQPAGRAGLRAVSREPGRRRSPRAPGGAETAYVAAGARGGRRGRRPVRPRRRARPRARRPAGARRNADVAPDAPAPAADVTVDPSIGWGVLAVQHGCRRGRRAIHSPERPAARGGTFHVKEGVRGGTMGSPTSNHGFPHVAIALRRPAAARRRSRRAPRRG